MTGIQSMTVNVYMTHSDGVEHRAHEKISGWDLNMHKWYR